MYSFGVFLLLKLLLIVGVSCIEEWRYIEDDSLGNISDFEITSLLNFKVTTLLDIQLKGKSEISEKIFNGLIGSDGVKMFKVSGNSSKIDEKTCKHLEHVRQDVKEINKKLSDVVNALREMNLEVAKIKQYHYNIENNVEKENDGFKTTVGVRYKYSSIRNTNAVSSKTYPKSCKEILDSGSNVSGIYEIQPKISKKPITVLCDMEIRGGGWTTIQKRFDGSQDFLLGWRDYKFGFGDLDDEFWIGLENIYKITVQDGTELLVELEDRDGARAYAHYTSFKIGSEKEGYPLSILNGYSGDAGDALTHHLKMNFTTKDFDQDSNTGNCAILYSGGWWYKSCHRSNLNGKYMNLDLPAAYTFQGLHWAGVKPLQYSYAKSRMLLRSA